MNPKSPHLLHTTHTFDEGRKPGKTQGKPLQIIFW
jgi:hypothetical protein